MCVMHLVNISGIVLSTINVITRLASAGFYTMFASRFIRDVLAGPFGFLWFFELVDLTRLARMTSVDVVINMTTTNAFD